MLTDVNEILDLYIKSITSKEWKKLPDIEKKNIALKTFSKISDTDWFKSLDENTKLEFMSLFNETWQRTMKNPAVPTPEQALKQAQAKWIEEETKEPSLADITIKSLETGATEFAKGFWGALDALTGGKIKTISEAVEEGKQAVVEKGSSLVEDVGKIQSPAKATIADLLAKIVPTITLSAMSLASGGAIGGVPGSLGAFGSIATGSKYAELKDREDISDARKYINAILTGATEAITELIPTTKLFSLYKKKPIREGLKELAELVISEPVTENISNLSENILDVLTGTAEKSDEGIKGALRKTIEQIPETTLASTGQALIMGSPSLLLGLKTGKGKQQKQQQQQLEEVKQPEENIVRAKLPPESFEDVSKIKQIREPIETVIKETEAKGEIKPILMPEVLNMLEEFGLPETKMMSKLKRVIGSFVPVNAQTEVYFGLFELPFQASQVTAHETLHAQTTYGFGKDIQDIMQHILNNIGKIKNELLNNEDKGWQQFFGPYFNVILMTDGDNLRYEFATDVLASYLTMPNTLKKVLPETFDVVDSAFKQYKDNDFVKYINAIRQKTATGEIVKERSEKIKESFKKSEKELTEAEKYGKRRFSLWDKLMNAFYDFRYIAIKSAQLSLQEKVEAYERLINLFKKNNPHIYEAVMNKTENKLNPVQRAVAQDFKILYSTYMSAKDNLKIFSKRLRNIFSDFTFFGNAVHLFLKKRANLFKGLSKEDIEDFGLFLFLKNIITKTELIQERRNALNKEYNELGKQFMALMDDIMGRHFNMHIFSIEEAIEAFEKYKNELNDILAKTTSDLDKNTIISIKKIYKSLKNLKQRLDSLIIRAEPFGMTYELAQQQLQELEQRLGPEKMEFFNKLALEDSNLWTQEILMLLYESGIINEQMLEDFTANKYYSPYSVMAYLIKNARIFGSPTQVAKLFRTTGTVKKIRNPHIAKYQKGVELINLATKNMLYKNLVNELLGVGLAEKAVMVDNKYIEKKNATIYVFDNGKLYAYYIPREIYEAIHTMPYEFLGNFRLFRMTMSAIKGLFTVFNPKWLTANEVRDIGSVYFALPKVSALTVLREVYKALMDSIAYNFSDKITPEIETMIKEHKLRIDGVFDVLERASSEEALLMKYGVEIENDKDVFKTGLKAVDAVLNGFYKAFRLAKKPLEAISDFAQSLEMAKKIAGDRLLKNAPEDFKKLINEAKANNAYVRDFLSTPNVKIRGLFSSFVDFVYWFTKVSINGMMAVKEVFELQHLYAKKLSQTKTEYIKVYIKDNLLAWKVFKGIVFPAVVTGLATAGLFDDDDWKEKYGFMISDMFESIPLYERQNNFCIPVMYDVNTRKTTYFKIPLPYGISTIYSLVYSIFSLQAFKDRKSIMYTIKSSNPVGSENPFIATVNDFIDILNERPPVDFLEREWLSEDELLNLKEPIVQRKIAKYLLLNRFGLSAFFGYYRDKLTDFRSDFEKALDIYPLNSLKAFYSESNIGYVDKVKSAIREGKMEEGLARIILRDFAGDVALGKRVAYDEEEIRKIVIAFLSKRGYYNKMLENFLVSKSIQDPVINNLLREKNMRIKMKILEKYLEEEK